VLEQITVEQFGKVEYIRFVHTIQLMMNLLNHIKLVNGF